MVNITGIFLTARDIVNQLNEQVKSILPIIAIIELLKYLTQSLGSICVGDIYSLQWNRNLKKKKKKKKIINM